MSINSKMLREVTAGYNLKNQVNDSIYRNTKYLLELYSKVWWRINSSLDEMDQECIESTNRKLSELINSMVDVDNRVNEERLNARLRSIENSKSILDLIDISLIQLKRYPVRGEEYYDILTNIYIKRTEKSVEKLAEAYNVSRSTMYRKRNDAINMFGVILWGYLVDEVNKN